MAVLLVIYEIQDGQKRSRVANALKKRHRISVKLTESAFAIHTQLLPVRVFDEIKEYLDSDDLLYVIPLTRPYTGFGPRRTTRWLSDYLSG